MGYRGSGCTAIETCSDEHGIRGGKPGRKKAWFLSFKENHKYTQ